MDNDDTTPPPSNDPAPDRLARIFGHLTGTMVAALPRPVPATPEAFAARNLTAVSQVAALVPVNPIETMFAVQLVVAAAQGIECQRMAQAAEPVTSDRHIHQAAKMMRVSQGTANVLLRLQAARQAREATSASSAALTEHCALQLMLQALTRLDAEKAAAERAAVERAAAEQAAAEAARQAQPPPPEPEPITEQDIAAAEAYAQTNPSNLNRARILRRKRGMPDWGMFTPPEDNVVRAIAFGHSPFLDALLP